MAACINDKVFQIGLRGTGYSAGRFRLGPRQGLDGGAGRGVLAQVADTADGRDLRDRIGDAPVYLTYDIDSLDPAFAPGTGTVEPGGLTIWQGLEIVRGCAGLNLVGGDLVEVSPPYDPSGNTALIGAEPALRNALRAAAGGAAPACEDLNLGENGNDQFKKTGDTPAGGGRTGIGGGDQRAGLVRPYRSGLPHSPSPMRPASRSTCATTRAPARPCP